MPFGTKRKLGGTGISGRDVNLCVIDTIGTNGNSCSSEKSQKSGIIAISGKVDGKI